jgi:hypothetical protein
VLAYAVSAIRPPATAFVAQWGGLVRIARRVGVGIVSDSNWDPTHEIGPSRSSNPSRNRRQRRSELVSCAIELLLIALLIAVWALSVG